MSGHFDREYVLDCKETRFGSRRSDDTMVEDELRRFCHRSEDHVIGMPWRVMEPEQDRRSCRTPIENLPAIGHSTKVGNASQRYI